MKQVSVIVSLVLLVGLPLVGCQPADDTSTIRAKIEEQDKTFVDAFNSKDVDRIMSVYWNSPDLIALYPDANYRGYDAVKRSWQTMFSAMDVKKFQYTESHLIVGKNVSYEWGTFEFDFQPKGAPEIQSTGRYLDVWENKDGVWVITADHASETPKPMGQAPAGTTGH